MHFERNHNLIPEIDPEEYELQLLPRGKNDENPISLSFEDLKKMP
jgi:DMSO/TMAO reductase YedYZ molybdopterin-dependent catalytic subunit